MNDGNGLLTLFSISLVFSRATGLEKDVPGESLVGKPKKDSSQVGWSAYCAQPEIHTSVCDQSSREKKKRQ